MSVGTFMTAGDFVFKFEVLFWTVDNVDVQPLQMSINKDEEHFAHERTAWTWAHGHMGHSHGCSGAWAGAFWWLWHMAQFFIFASRSVSIPGHHTWL